jgi:hypothetical protein
MGGRFNYMEIPEPDIYADGPHGALEKPGNYTKAGVRGKN